MAYLKPSFKTAISFIFAIALVQGMNMGSLLAGKKNLTIEEKFNRITAQQKALYNIVHSEWRGTYGFIVGCHSCEGALYDPVTGGLLNSTSLTTIPTSWNIRIPSEWNGKVTMTVPPGTLDQVMAFTNLTFLGTFLSNQYAVAIMNHPSPGFPGFAYAQFSDAPYTPREYRKEYAVTSHTIKHLIRDIFGRPESIYGVSSSRGVSLGLGMFLDAPHSVFDGFLVSIGGNGYEGSFEAFQDAFERTPNALGLTGVPPIQTTAALKVERLLFFLGAVDPVYNNYVKSAATADEQLARSLAYDISQQPRKIRRDWNSIAMGTNLQRPTILFQGLRDRTVPPETPLDFMFDVEDNCDADLLRAYLIKDFGHVPANDPPGMPNPFFVEGLAKLEAWVEHGVEPSPMHISPYTPSEQPSCTGRGLDAADCFCETLEDGVGGFCSDDASVACITTNPAKSFFPAVPPLFIPVPDDTCVGLGKGVCVPELPQECG